MPISIQAALTKKLTPTEAQIKKILDESKNGQLYRSEEMVDLVPCCRQMLFNTVHTLKDYSIKYGLERYFGKPATIADFKKQAGVK